MKRGVLIGCGFFAQNHLHAWELVEGAEIVAVCDTDEARARRYAEGFGVAGVYTDAKMMLTAETPDFVDIATQAHSHYKLCTLAAQHSVNIICQKPLAPSLEEAEQIVRACQNVTFMVHENFRWQRPMLELKRASAELGELFFGRIHFRSAYDVYVDQPYLATDERFILYDLGVHLFDLARFFFGEVRTFTCHTQRVNPDIAAEDVATALLKMESGAHVVVDMSYASKLERELFPQTLIELEGTAGSVCLGADYQLGITTAARTQHLDVSPRAFDWTLGTTNAVPESVLNIQQHFTDCLVAGRAPDTTGEDNLKTLELTFGAYRSAASARSLDFGKKP